MSGYSAVAVDAASAPVDVVVKIGGSACTIKSSFETLNEPALHAVCDQLAAAVKAGRTVAIVHGAGSFGHKQAREYGISKGADGNNGGGAGLMSASKREGFAKTRLSVTTLNKHVITALIDRGVPAVTISPCPFIGTTGKKIKDGLDNATVQSVRGMLERGLVPVVHGDAVMDDVQGCAILSGDIWMVEMPRTLKARRAVFVTDVDGVFTKPPTEEGAQLIPEILVDAKTGDFSLPGVEMSCDTKHDVTGGLQEKLKCAADVLREAPSVQDVYIVRAGSKAAAEAIRGDPPSSGTVLRRNA